MNDDLISREAVLKEICLDCHKPFPQYPVHGCPDPCYTYGGVSNLPAVDAVEVVRCKDCKHYSEYEFGISHTPTLACVDVDKNGVVKFAVATPPDHFCAKGERRNE